MTPRRSNKQKRLDYVADFETTTREDDCRVWGWGMAALDRPDMVHMAHTMDEFIDYVQCRNAVIYFHNLKFDGTFILDYLLNNDYAHTDERAVLRGQFTTLISDQGRWYSLRVTWRNGNTTEFRDSLNKLPMSLARVAKAFKFEEGKGEIDYHKPRPVGYVMDDDERDYLRRDVSIIARAMKLTLDEGMDKLTVGADSLSEYKELFGQKLFQRMFPVLPDAMDAEIRKAYRGGWTYAAKRFAQKRQGCGLVLDVNSLYPYIMYSTKLPYGEPIWQPGKPDFEDEQYPLVIFSVTITAKLKPRHVPCIQVKGSSIFLGTEYVESIDEPTTLSVTNADWELWNEQYDIEVYSWDGGWKFRSVEGVFKEYIDKWSKIKAEATGGLRELAKLHLNSLYGKFATNPNVVSKIPYLKNGVVSYYRGPDETRPPVYTAMGVFITSYARALTIRAAQANYDVFAYADTDSLHLLTQTIPPTLDVHPTRLGAWKHEYDFAEALYIRPKAYLERKHAQVPYAKGEYVNAVAGLPVAVSAQLTFENAYDGAIITGKKTQVNVAGGMVLRETEYKMKYPRL